MPKTTPKLAIRHWPEAQSSVGMVSVLESDLGRMYFLD